MADVIEQLTEKAKAVVGPWPTYAAVGSFVLYVLGYLTLRFHLTTLGVGTDLAVLDERYLFSGAKFLVYLLSSVPIVVLLILVATVVVLVIGGVAYIPYRLLPKSVRTRTKSRVRVVLRSISVWWSGPGRLALAGIIVSVVLIQLVMRQCFVFSNLLLAESLPDPPWLASLFLSGEESKTLYFSGLIFGCATTGAMLFGARRLRVETLRSKFLTGLLSVMVAIQFLLLPVNYGVVIADKILPRVANLGGKEPLKDGERAWLVWEGNSGTSYLVRTAQTNGAVRKLVTVDKKDVSRNEIIKYDLILRCIFLEGECFE